MIECRKLRAATISICLSARFSTLAASHSTLVVAASVRANGGNMRRQKRLCNRNSSLLIAHFAYAHAALLERRGTLIARMSPPPPRRKAKKRAHRAAIENVGFDVARAATSKRTHVSEEEQRRRRQQRGGGDAGGGNRVESNCARAAILTFFRCARARRRCSGCARRAMITAAVYERVKQPAFGVRRAARGNVREGRRRRSRCRRRLYSPSLCQLPLVACTCARRSIDRANGSSKKKVEYARRQNAGRLQPPCSRFVAALLRRSSAFASSGGAVERSKCCRGGVGRRRRSSRSLSRSRDQPPRFQFRMAK